MAYDNKVDAIIVIGQVRRSFIDSLSQLTIPLLFVDFYDSRYNIDSVNSDSYNGGYMITDYLVEMGHRKIGFFGTVNATSTH